MKPPNPALLHCHYPRKHIAVMVFRINEARGQKTASKFLNKQHQWQSGTICAV